MSSVCPGPAEEFAKRTMEGGGVAGGLENVDRWRARIIQCVVPGHLSAGCIVRANKIPRYKKPLLPTYFL